jgi:fructuronate reductase
VSAAATARLSRRSLGGHVLVPAVAPARAGIVHLGLGSFHRAHQAVYTARALDREDGGPWGIVGVAHRSHRVADALRAQDGLYCVLALGGVQAAPLVVGVHTELLVAAEQAAAVVARLADPATRVVTLTVTERGYTARSGSGGLDTDDPQVRADLAGSPPSTTIGLLARGLQRRREHGQPLAVVSCDNVPHNGEHTRALVLDFAGLLPDPDAAELRAWIERSIAFPSTMVDRIVPATRPEHRAHAAELLGLDDAAPVAAEPFSMWVLEDRFPAGRPRWETAGAVFSDEVERYEELKLRLLNATHSLLAYLGLLAGERSIAGAVARPEIRTAAEHLVHRELRPTLDAPAGLDVVRYADELFARFANAALDHRTRQVASDGSAKLPARITGAVRHHTARGAVPRALALTVAAYVRCLATPGAYDAALGAVADPRRDELEELGRRARGSRELVAAVFELGIFPADLREATAFVDAIGELHAVLVAHGHRAAIEAAIG